MNTDPVVISVSTSPGGIPKLPLDGVRVGIAGLEGDGHNHEKHCTPLQAVCLFDIEDMEDLCREGYDLVPGSVGENVLVRGLNVDALVIGDRLMFSGGLEIEISKARTPCYVLDAIDPTLKKAMRRRAGMYARVITPAELRPGEHVVHTPSITGAILAGGLSSRMGGEPKQNLRMRDGRVMIEAVAQALGEACREIVILGECDSLPSLRRLPDLRSGQGPLGGIEALLASGLNDRYLICPCDLPAIDAEPLRALANAPRDAPAAVLRFDDREAFDPLPARLAAGALPVVRRLLDEGRRSVHELMSELVAHEVAASAAWRSRLVNINTPEDADAAGAQRR